MTDRCLACSFFPPGEPLVVEGLCRACARSLKEEGGIHAPWVVWSLLQHMTLREGYNLQVLDAIVLCVFQMAGEGASLTPRGIQRYLKSRCRLELPTAAIRRSLRRLERHRLLVQVGGGGYRGAGDLAYQQRRAPSPLDALLKERGGI